MIELYTTLQLGIAKCDGDGEVGTNRSETFHCLSSHSSVPHTTHSLFTYTHMKQFSADLKHAILLHYRPQTRGHSFAALASQHGVTSGWKTIQRWYNQWDGTVASLQRKQVSGRPRKLSRAQVNRSLKPRILAANRRHTAVHYPSLLPVVEQTNAVQLSLRTLQRYGKQQLHAKQKHTIARTKNECTSHIYIEWVNQRMNFVS